MGSLSDKLNYLKTAKSDIKSALSDLGKNPNDVFETYAGLVDTVEGKGAVANPSDLKLFERIDWPANTIYGYSKIQDGENSDAYNVRLLKNIENSETQLEVDPSTGKPEWITHKRLGTGIRGNLPRFVNWNKEPFVYSPLISLPANSLTSAQNLYIGANKLEIVPPIDTFGVTSFKSMFSACNSLWLLSKFDTSQGTDFSGFLKDCFNLRTIPDFDTSKMASAWDMFKNCRSLEKIPNSFNTDKLTNATNMFSGCRNLYSIPNLNLANIELIENPDKDNKKVLGIFDNCLSLTEVGGLTGLKEDLDLMGCPNITPESMHNIATTVADLTSLGLPNKTINMPGTLYYRMAQEDRDLFTSKGWDIPHGSLDATSKSRLIQMGWTDTDISNFEKYGIDWEQYEDNVYSVPESDLETPKGNIRRSDIVTNYNKTIHYAPKYDIDTITDDQGRPCASVFAEGKNIIGIPNIIIKPMADRGDPDISNLCSGCENLRYFPPIDFTGFQQGYYLFTNCKRLLYIDSIDVSEFTGIGNAFQNCSSLVTIKELDLSGIGVKTYNGNQYGNIGDAPFSGCTSLRNVGGFKGLNLGLVSVDEKDPNFNFEDCPLSHQSIKNILTKLAPSTDREGNENYGYVKFSHSCLDLLDEEDYRIAEEKRVIIL